jgi:hypothetical protein
MFKDQVKDYYEIINSTDYFNSIVAIGIAQNETMEEQKVRIGKFNILTLRIILSFVIRLRFGPDRFSLICQAVFTLLSTKQNFAINKIIFKVVRQQ